MKSHNDFMPGDPVNYTGQKQFKDHKGNPYSLRDKVGFVISKVEGDAETLVVEFGDDAYIMSASNLRRHTFAPGKEFVVETKRRRMDDEE